MSKWICFVNSLILSNVLCLIRAVWDKNLSWVLELFDPCLRAERKSVSARRLASPHSVQPCQFDWCSRKAIWVPPYEKTKPLHARHSSLDFRKADKEKDFMRQNVFEVQLVTSCPIASAPARGLSAKSHLNTKQRPVIFMDKDYQAASAKCSEFFWVASHLCKDLLQKTFLAGHLDLS